MGSSMSMPTSAAITISDMLDKCAKLQTGQEVLILAHIDGLYGGDNMVDPVAIEWLQAGIKFRGAKASVLWVDEPAVAHEWRFPPIVKAAMGACDLIINHSFDLVMEEMLDFRATVYANKKVMIRNFATTAPLLCTYWAQTPYELVSEIRYRSSLAIQPGLKWTLTDPNGTDLAGVIMPPSIPSFTSYSMRRDESFTKPFPEWVHPPVVLGETNGTYVFQSMLGWWSRYIGISPYFEKPIRLTIESNRITKIEGDDEAEALQRFLESMKGRVGDGVYNFDEMHWGVHPQAAVAPHQCPNPLHRRTIEHSQSSCLHAHIGAPRKTPEYPYWLHITADIFKATFKVGDTLVYDGGHLTALDDPVVREVAAQYPGRPGLEPVPRSW